MKLFIQPTLLLRSTDRLSRDFDLTHIGDILQRVAQGHTLTYAANDLNISYRTLWNELKEAEKKLNCKLLDRIRGHGSKVTANGQLLINSLEKLNQLSTQMQELADIISNQLTIHKKIAPTQFIFCCSSDPLIEQICPQFVEVELQTMGSGNALTHLIEGKAQIAGFHISDRQEMNGVGEHIKLHGLELMPLMQRVQGLIVGKGNPLRITTVRDLARPEVRFINRQKGAGTRLLLDRLLTKEGLKAKQIRGYDQEEFTHNAIATSILAGQTDAGIGLQYVAKKFNLDFIPLKIETFYLAMKSELIEHEKIIVLTKNIRNLSKKTPGYKIY
jgi:molybdate transport repressor ModE-like protein